MLTGGIKVFGGSRGEPLANEICRLLRIAPGQRKLTRFGDGEISLQIQENVRGHDVFIVNQASSPAEDLLETIFLARTAVMSSASRVTIVIAYLGYNRQERKDRSRVPISAKIVIEMLKTARADRVLLLDLHSEATAAHFEPEMVHDHLYCSKVTVPYLQSILTDPFVVASADAGGVPRARKYAQHLNTNELVIFSKNRKQAGQVEEDSIQIIGDVRGRDVILVDDMIDSGGTLIADAKAAKEAGAKRIFACASHALFSKGLELFPSGLFTEIIVTDSVGNDPKNLISPNVKVTSCSVAPLLADAIIRLNQDKSMSDLILS
jgi:ribose-phosphate pyrophosphokinase